MPVITIEGPPRDIETKRKLVKQFTAIFKEIYGYPEDFSHVVIIIRENVPENIGTNGELLIDKKKK
ncbi:MAG: 4-oxalocrotonate tautomerase [Promethearchaeota archaeon]|nr:MAG: 4-oxalocrotonate tautomerase [Candidatus Lokiarchaeota archaeon]